MMVDHKVYEYNIMMVDNKYMMVDDKVYDGRLQVYDGRQKEINQNYFLSLISGLNTDATSFSMVDIFFECSYFLFLRYQIIIANKMYIIDNYDIKQHRVCVFHLCFVFVTMEDCAGISSLFDVLACKIKYNEYTSDVWLKDIVS